MCPWKTHWFGNILNWFIWTLQQGQKHDKCHKLKSQRLFFWKVNKKGPTLRKCYGFNIRWDAFWNETQLIPTILYPVSSQFQFHVSCINSLHFFQMLTRSPKKHTSVQWKEKWLQIAPLHWPLKAQRADAGTLVLSGAIIALSGGLPGQHKAQ